MCAIVDNNQKKKETNKQEKRECVYIDEFICLFS